MAGVALAVPHLTAGSTEMPAATSGDATRQTSRPAAAMGRAARRRTRRVTTHPAPMRAPIPREPLAPSRERPGKGQAGHAAARGCAYAIAEGVARATSIRICQQQLLAAVPCCLGERAGSRAQRGEQSLSEALSSPLPRQVGMSILCFATCSAAHLLPHQTSKFWVFFSF